MTTKHTPTPWFIEHSCLESLGQGSEAQLEAAQQNRCTSAAGGHLMICCPCHDMCPEQTVVYYSSAESDANLDFICKACNSHDALLAACKEFCDAMAQPSPDYYAMSKTVLGARAAIKAAEGE